MALKVIVWGTGNVGRPSIRAVLSHADLQLVGVVVSNPDKVGEDADNTQRRGLQYSGNSFPGDI